MMTMLSQPIKILLVEDNYNYYVIMKRLLMRMLPSLELDWQNTYDAALNAINNGEYDLCLMDYMLDTHTGLDLLRQIRSDGSRMPVIMITGRSDQETDLAAMEAGADDYLVKGEFNIRLLERSIRYAIAGRRSEEALRLSQSEVKKERDFIASVLDTMANLVIVLDTEGTIVRFNPACERLTGYRADEVIGKRFGDILIAPDEPERVVGTFNDLVDGEPSGSYENHWVTKQGDLRLISWSNTTLLDPESNVRHIIGTGIDITGQKRAEQQINFQAHLLDVIGQAVIATDLAGVITYWNKAAEVLYGWSSSEAVGASIST